MSKLIEINNNKYEIIREYKDGFNREEFIEKYTDYFDTYDYIFGDYSYNKLRLKGYNDKTNKGFNKINDINTLDNYIKEYCSYECKYFLLKKCKDK